MGLKGINCKSFSESRKLVEEAGTDLVDARSCYETKARTENEGSLDEGDREGKKLAGWRAGRRNNGLARPGSWRAASQVGLQKRRVHWNFHPIRTNLLLSALC